MGTRIGVDVGGTFTKAIAYDLDRGRITAQAVLPTTHDHPEGVAAGVVDAVRQVADQVGADRVDLVVHSTTQAVNALLEGDVGRVGVVGLGRRPEIAKVRRRTELSAIDLAPGKRLQTVPAFFDVTDGLPVDDIRATLADWQQRRHQRGVRGRGLRSRRLAQRGRRGRPGPRGGPAGLRLHRADRPVRPGAAGRHRRHQRLDRAHRPPHRRIRRAGRGRGRHHQPGARHAG